MLVVHCDNSVMSVDLHRFLFGGGEWVVTVEGTNLFG